jgi:hypothetical protein
MSSTHNNQVPISTVGDGFWWNYDLFDKQSLSPSLSSSNQCASGNQSSFSLSPSPRRSVGDTSSK